MRIVRISYHTVNRKDRFFKALAWRLAEKRPVSPTQIIDLPLGVFPVCGRGTPGCRPGGTIETNHILLKHKTMWP
jgi:hypothetical protein